MNEYRPRVPPAYTHTSTFPDHFLKSLKLAPNSAAARQDPPHPVRDRKEPFSQQYTTLRQLPAKPVSLAHRPGASPSYLTHCYLHLKNPHRSPLLLRLHLWGFQQLKTICLRWMGCFRKHRPDLNLHDELGDFGADNLVS